MAYASLTLATQAVLNALTELGQGNVHELADKAGKARSTTDKALKTLADLNLIVTVDTGADPAEGVPTRWTLAEGIDPTLDDTDGLDPADTEESYSDLDGDDGADLADSTDELSDVDPAELPDDIDPAEVADEPVVDEDSSDEPNDGDGGQDESDAGKENGEQADADAEAGNGDTDRDGEAEVQANESTSTDQSAASVAAPIAVVTAARPGDRKVMAIKGVLADCGQDGATVAVIVAESGIGLATATRLLTAMEQADAARRLPGAPERWISGPTKASEVDPNPEPPRCPVCYQTVKAFATTPAAMAAIAPLVQADGTLHVVGPDGQTHVVTLPKRPGIRVIGGSTASGARQTDLTANGDGSQPFIRGELEKLTVDYMTARPGRQLTPQDVATGLSAELNRVISSGAVRNNMTKAAAGGQLLLVSENPLKFVYLAPEAAADASPDGDENGQAAEPDRAEDAHPADEMPGAQPESDADSTDQS